MRFYTHQILILFSCLLGVSAAAQSVDFSLTWDGPSSVAQGHPLFLQLSKDIVSGTDDDYCLLEVEGVPAGVEVDFVDARITCCGQTGPTTARLWRIAGSHRIAFYVSKSALPGSYPVTLTATSKGVARKASFSLTIRRQPRPLDRTDPGATAPTVPLLTQWRDAMSTYGAGHFSPAMIANWGPGYEAHAWYYDGSWVARQISEYLGDPAWMTRSNNAHAKYASWATSGVTGWRVFPDGIYEYWKANNRDAAALTALQNLIQKSSYGRTGGGIPTSLSREAAYMLRTYVRNEQAGEPPFFLSSEKFSGRERNAAYALGHLQLWNENPERYMQPFMVALTTDALILYFEDRMVREHSVDVRVQEGVRDAAQFLMDRAWIEGSKAFYYDNAQKAPAPDLNMLIARTFSWLYQQTGERRYIDIGNKVFQGGVEGAWLAGGKQFSQNYRRSLQYVKEATVLPKYIRSTALSAKSLGPTRVTVTWTTSVPARSMVRFKAEGETTWSESSEGTEATTAHTVALTGLEPSTAYLVQIAPIDADGAPNLGGQLTVTTLAGNPSSPNRPTNLQVVR